MWTKLQGSIVPVLKQCFLFNAQLINGFLNRLPGFRNFHTANAAAAVHMYTIRFIVLCQIRFMSLVDLE